MGKNVPTALSEQISVRLTEVDGCDEVLILQRQGNDYLLVCRDWYECYAHFSGSATCSGFCGASILFLLFPRTRSWRSLPYSLAGLCHYPIAPQLPAYPGTVSMSLLEPAAGATGR